MLPGIIPIPDSGKAAPVPDRVLIAMGFSGPISAAKYNPVRDLQTTVSTKISG